ncbi:MAG: Lrp/AsnC ligand binding domain-containing protein [Solirubrobacteraceae bacterium]|nr:Lrp/AsnC ligand binding domain-containing protein [Solirubrobacteraceae bacterium]
MLTLGGDIAAIPGVTEVYGVTGEWDFVAVVAVESHARLGEVVTVRVASLEGVARTQTLVALDTYRGAGGSA